VTELAQNIIAYTRL